MGQASISATKAPFQVLAEETFHQLLSVRVEESPQGIEHDVIDTPEPARVDERLHLGEELGRDFRLDALSTSLGFHSGLQFSRGPVESLSTPLQCSVHSVVIVHVMTRGEYERRKQRIEEQLRAGIELMESAYRAQIRALDLVWMVQAEEDAEAPPPPPAQEFFRRAAERSPLWLGHSETFGDGSDAPPRLSHRLPRHSPEFGDHSYRAANDSP
jgi:hypothetical protein